MGIQCSPDIWRNTSQQTLAPLFRFKQFQRNSSIMKKFVNALVFLAFVAEINADCSREIPENHDGEGNRKTTNCPRSFRGPKDRSPEGYVCRSMKLGSTEIVDFKCDSNGQWVATDTGCPEQCASATDCKSGKGKIAGGKVTSNYQRLCKHYCSSNGYCGTVDKTTNCTGCKKIDFGCTDKCKCKDGEKKVELEWEEGVATPSYCEYYCSTTGHCGDSDAYKGGIYCYPCAPDWE